MQPDGRLIENIAGSYQPGSQAGGQLNALGLPARERGRQPIQRELIESDVVQELEPLANLDQDLVGDL